LQKVVAGGGDEAAARGVGAFGLGKRVFEIVGAFHDSLFQRFVRLAECFQRGAFGGDIGEAHHEATIGHFLGEDVEDGIVTAQFEGQGRAATRQARPGFEPCPVEPAADAAGLAHPQQEDIEAGAG
jgi:hypothetical protein